MKECISERDHYRLFPPKQYQFDEECDLIEMDGDEFAYCLCRKNLCNLKNIIDQFIDFEESHPEIFVATNDDVVDDKHDERFPVLSQGRYPTQLNYPSIRNIDQMETSIHYGTVKSVPFDERSNDNVKRNHSGLSHQRSSFPSKKNYEPTMFSGNIMTNVPFGQNSPSVQMDKANGKFMASKQIAPFLEINQQNVEVNENYCYNCMEIMDDPRGDCSEIKIVHCPISKISGRSQMCITKQSHETNNNLYKLEKRCGTDIEENEVEFDELSVRKIVCMITLDASQTYCLCLGHYCNRDSLLEQIEKVTQRSNESRSLINSKFNENIDSIVSPTVAQSQIVANDHMKLATIPKSLSSSPLNFVSSSDAWKLNEMENLEHQKENNGNTIASRNLFIYFIIIIIIISSIFSS